MSSGSVVARHSVDYGEESDDELKQEDISFNDSSVGAQSVPGLNLTPAGRSISLDPAALLAGTVPKNRPRIEAAPLSCCFTSHQRKDNKGLSINYVIADRGGGVSPKDYSIT